MITGAAAGTGTGTVTVTDTTSGTCTGQASCPATTGDAITVTATATGGSTFTGWTTGSCLLQTANCAFLAGLTDETDTADFTAPAPPPTYTVTGDSNPAGGGTVTATSATATCAGNSCTGVTGDAVTLTETPADHSTFSGWSAAGCPGTPDTCDVAIGAGNATYTANFTAVPQYTVTGASAAHGSVAVASTAAGATCTADSCTVYSGGAVTLTATPASAYYQFSGWSGGSCAAANPCNVTPTHNETDTAAFALAGALDPSKAVYVSPSGSDSNSGTAAAPVRTPSKGIAIAAGGGETQVWIAQGTYSGPLAVTAADDGLGVYGNFNASTWTESATTPSATTISGSPEGLIATDATVSFDLVNFAGQAPGGPSSTAYGVVALSGSNLTLTAAVVTAGNGSAGANGAGGTAGLPGGAGGAGGAGQTPAQVAAACLASNGTRCNPVDGSGGAAGRGVNGNDFFVLFNAAYDKNPLLHVMALELPAPAAGPSAGDGGFGGFGNTHSAKTLQGCGGKGKSLACGPERIVAKHREVIGTYYGGWGSPPADAPTAAEGSGGKPGYANVNGDGYPGNNGTDGADGGAGANGGPGASTSVAGPAWTPGNGAAGSSGGPGAGGGGGGGGGGNIAIAQAAVASGSGNGGGGGGGGGSGSSGGSGGSGGGGSFGIYLDGGSTATIAAGSTIAAGNGGAGGNGGPGGGGGAGGAGGAGGTNGTPQEGSGGNGGNGGDGGPGGAGGGGAGGPSIAAYAADNGSTSHVAPGVPLTGGSPGVGGVSGAGGSSPVRAPGGASASCLGNCKPIASLPLVLPALGLVHNRHVAARLECDAACHGTGLLQLLPTGAGPGSARFSFHLAFKGFVTLHMALNKAARAGLGSHKSLLVELTITATVGGGHRETYVSTFDLARTPPKPRHK